MTHAGKSRAVGATLTPVERSVADLVAQAMTNREIAARLALSPHTIDTHLRNIFRKLGVSSRVALAAEIVRIACRRDGRCRQDEK